jgi:predicted DCC family thiol-disulfide oxidoreductase YuxK
VASLERVRHVILLYDADCGFCKWTTAKVLAWDRRGRLRPMALQDPEADALLGGMGQERKMASWHLVGSDGDVYSAGKAFPPLLRLLPGGRFFAAAAARFPGLTDRLYDYVAARRSPLGRVLKLLGGAAVLERAERRISERARCAE